GARVGARIAEIAPLLRAQHLRLIVAFVNNHQAVPGELPDSVGWMDNYFQLLLPFYTSNWRGAYLHFVHDLVSTVEYYNAQDVVYAWELGNELHTPRQPDAIVPFIMQVSAVVRQLDPLTPILPGTMGANHVEPDHPNSAIARWLYCDAPVDAYTLHAYDWVSRQRPGDMPIDWDLDNIVSQPCANGRALPLIVEELGTSRALPGVYTADDEQDRLAQETRQIQFVRQFPGVVGFGVWNAESPRLVDRTFVDVRRGLTSYGSGAQGGGSCYDPRPDPGPGVRCQLEQVLRGLRFVRVTNAEQWISLSGSSTDTPLVGAVDPLSSGDVGATTLSLTGWLTDPNTGDSNTAGVDGLSVYLGNDPAIAPTLATAHVGLPRADVTAAANPGFAFDLPLDELPAGVDQLTLIAHTSARGAWQTSVTVVVPNLGSVPSLPVVAPVSVAPPPALAPAPGPQAEIDYPQPGEHVARNFVVEVNAPGAGRVDVFLDPDRDQGGHLVGSTLVASPQTTLIRVAVTAPLGATTLHVHISSSLQGSEEVLTIPIIVRS
ncbi:MAG: hypothetical protein JOZ99_03810, partial [Actinobacteria bacterium]|nr:hypothetical protein [Actinomycetota bacterium]